MKKHFRVSTALLAAVLLAGCGSISSKDGGYYATESPSAEGAYDTAAGAANSSIVTSPLRNTFIFNYSLSGLRRRRLIIRSRRHSTHASNITLIAASTASRIGWFASAYHKRSNHGR